MNVAMLLGSVFGLRLVALLADFVRSRGFPLLVGSEN
jgi:hypothetical protein